MLQRVEAQTLSTCYSAAEEGLTIIPVLNKIDLDQADTEKVKKEIEEIIGIDASDAPCISAKKGIGIEEVLEQVISNISPPSVNEQQDLQASIIDSWFDNYLGLNNYQTKNLLLMPASLAAHLRKEEICLK